MTKTCRICYGEDGDFISPCHCDGTMKWVHKTCINNWLEITSLKHCSTCHFQYVYKDVEMPLIERVLVTSVFTFTISFFLFICCTCIALIRIAIMLLWCVSMGNIPMPWFKLFVFVCLTEGCVLLYLMPHGKVNIVIISTLVAIRGVFFTGVVIGTIGLVGIVIGITYFTYTFVTNVYDEVYKERSRKELISF